MIAYVKVRRGNFPDVNYYLAWKGFTEIGYEVVKFEEEDIDCLDVTFETPVFAGVKSTREIIKRFFNFDYTGINPYPDELKPVFGRNIKKGKWCDLKQEVFDSHLFVKPVIQKEFLGEVMTSILQSIKMVNVKDDTEVYVSTPVQFLSEFRIYVNDGDIVGVKHYHGDWFRTPQMETIKECIKLYKPSAPISYGLDIGVIKYENWYRDVLVEINDGICLGNYGLDSIHYAEMLAARWVELTSLDRFSQKLIHADQDINPNITMPTTYVE